MTKGTIFGIIRVEVEGLVLEFMREIASGVKVIFVGGVYCLGTG